MIIAFEGVDKTGKSTLATKLDHSHSPLYSFKKEEYTPEFVTEYGSNESPVRTIDRVDWITHLVYRLALPSYEWNDPRIRTVCGLPDTHLVVLTHDRTHYISDELYDHPEQLYAVNQMYNHFIDWLIWVNEIHEFNLFRTITKIRVKNIPAKGVYERVLDVFSSPTGSVPRYSRLDSDKQIIDLLTGNLPNPKEK